MADVVVELVESKKDEIIEKALEQVNEKKEEVADKVEAAVEKAADEVGKKIEDIVDPQVAKVLDDVIGDQLDGREISCSCFGWLVALRITRKSQKTPPSKSEAVLSTQLPVLAPSAPATEQSPTKTPEPSQTDQAPAS